MRLPELQNPIEKRGFKDFIGEKTKVGKTC
jgi:hypothetical protein